jgi:hypothetical protein
VNTPLTLQSVNGPAVTVINGGGTNQCVYLATNAMLVGFTLTNGFTDGNSNNGGGVYCESINSVLSDCVLPRVASKAMSYHYHFNRPTAVRRDNGDADDLVGLHKLNIAARCAIKNILRAFAAI